MQHGFKTREYRANHAELVAHNARQSAHHSSSGTTRRIILNALRRSPDQHAANYLSQPDAPVSAAAIRLLIQYLCLVTDADFMAGTPLVWMQQGRIARDLCGKSDRTVRKLETELERAGLVLRATAANGHRSAHERTGIDLSPLIDRADEIEAMAASWIALGQRRADNIGEAKRLRGNILRQLIHLPLRVGARINSLRAIASVWPRRIADMSAEQLDRHIRFLRRLTRWMTFAALVIGGEMRSQTSGAAAKNDRPYTEEDDNEICNCWGNTADDETDSAMSERLEDQATDRSGADEDMAEESYTTALPAIPARPPVRINKATIRQAATPAMRAYLSGFEDALDPKACRDSQQVLSQIAKTRGFDLGIERWLLDKADQTLSPPDFFAAMLIVDSNRHHPNAQNRTRNPGGLMMALLRRAAAGNLNLKGAICGIIDRVQKGQQVLDAHG